ncbi:MAG: hypothetical protein H0T60_10310 [Acidobacteria bacterium]|nr:hypothetical protein [Acidobacteriota bacterium]
MRNDRQELFETEQEIATLRGRLAVLARKRNRILGTLPRLAASPEPNIHEADDELERLGRMTWEPTKP